MLDNDHKDGCLCADTEEQDQDQQQQQQQQQQYKEAWEGSVAAMPASNVTPLVP